MRNLLAAVLEGIAGAFERGTVSLDRRTARMAAARMARAVVRRRRDLSEYERRAVFARDGHLCLACGTPDDLEVDHVVPFSQGGPCTMANFQTLCGHCNREKGVRTIDYRVFKKRRVWA